MGQTVADVLGTSSVIINDLKLKRSAIYEFDLEDASKVRARLSIECCVPEVIDLLIMFSR